MNGDLIRLQFPARPDYILAIRLAISAVAQRVGFDVEDIEDIKVASAEACSLLLNTSPETITVLMTVDGGLRIIFEATGLRGAAEKSGDHHDGTMSQALIEALMDTCELTKDNGAVSSVKLEKKIQH